MEDLIVKIFSVEKIFELTLTLFGIGVLWLAKIYNFPFNLIGKKWKCEGYGNDLHKTKSCVKGKPYDFNGDFDRVKHIHNYKYTNVILTRFEKKIHIKGRMIADCPGCPGYENGPRESDFSGTGKYISGNNNVASIYVTNSRKVDGELILWNCIYFITFSPTSAIEGYWLTHSTENDNSFVMGTIHMDKKI
ncbi:MAG: hypothetical protein HAW58_01560 [Candidatus Thioglobus sp.]|nr:hypothetical protein [Candidatus Thioglobus sp.]